MHTPVFVCVLECMPCRTKNESTYDSKHDFYNLEVKYSVYRGVILYRKDRLCQNAYYYIFCLSNLTYINNIMHKCKEKNHISCISNSQKKHKKN